MQLHSYYPAQIVSKDEGEQSGGKSLPRGWSAIRVGQRLKLVWPDNVPSIRRQVPGASRLRITVAADFREAKLVEAYLPVSGDALGAFDIRYAYAFQPFELQLTADQTEAALAEGIGLRMDVSGEPLYIFDELGGEESRQFFAPHLYLEGQHGGPMEQFLERMASTASLQPFGWLEGCVLDGLYDLRQVLGTDKIDRVIASHLGQFLDEHGELRYEDLHGRPVAGAFTTIEATLPVGIIAKLDSGHPVVTRALAFWDSCGADSGGLVIDGDTVSAEGSYTVAYPLATVAVRYRRKELAEQAISQVLLRRDRLADGNHVHLRNNRITGERTFRSWARGYGWYMLGMMRTWLELKSSEFAALQGMSEIEAELCRVADAAFAWRQPVKLWSCFLDETDTGIDTSGSAGIAAALALGARHGLLPPSSMEAAKQSLDALQAYLTPDGLLAGVAQHNAGGLELQRGGYRVLSQMGMGLMAQLYAAVHAD